MTKVASWSNAFATVRMYKLENGKFQVTLLRRDQPLISRMPTDEYDAKFQFNMYVKQIKGEKS